MSKYAFNEIQNFVVQHGSVEHYEKDFVLYKKLFPSSPIVKELENPFPLKKKELDERMIFEILKEGRVCMETILENRGIVAKLSLEQTIKIQSEENESELKNVKSLTESLANDMEADERTAVIEKIKAIVASFPDELAETFKPLTFFAPALGEILEHQREAEKVELSSIRTLCESLANDMEDDQRAAIVTEITGIVGTLPEELAEAVRTELVTVLVPNTPKQDNETLINNENAEKKAAEEQLVNLKGDLSSLAYNDKKKLIYDLDLHEGLENMKGDTIDAALKERYSQLIVVVDKKKEVQE